MMETEPKSGGPVNRSPINKEIAHPLNVSNPPQCQRCTGEYEVFNMPGHPDNGVEFACGIMVENRDNGCMMFSCPYFKDSLDLSRARILHEIIDADKANEALRLVRLLKEHKRPVIVSEEVVYQPSPHEFLDPAIRRLKQEVR
jgi:hypothetical protein